MSVRRNRAALFKRAIEIAGGNLSTPPKLYIGPTRDKVLRTNPTHLTVPAHVCPTHGFPWPRKWCIKCAALRRGH
jgi:hypothetical protein